MCLLDAVESWDSSGIVCIATSHQLEKNPLRINDYLPSICGLEYAAQAMAVHVGLTSTVTHLSSAIGYLGGVRELQIETPRLDTHSGPLRIYGDLLFDQEYNFMYYFKITTDHEPLLKGRASLFIQRQTSPQ